MAQATLSCRFAAIHLVTPLLGFFRNYLPSRYAHFSPFLTTSRISPVSGRKIVCVLPVSAQICLTTTWSCHKMSMQDKQNCIICV